jgi:hypothetical protein
MDAPIHLPVQQTVGSFLAKRNKNSINSIKRCIFVVDTERS